MCKKPSISIFWSGTLFFKADSVIAKSFKFSWIANASNKGILLKSWATMEFKFQCANLKRDEMGPGFG